MKKLSFILALLMCASLIFSGCDKNPDSPDDGAMRENLTATEVAKEMGLGINLGNTMESYNAGNCTELSYKWPPKVGNNTPSDYETYWGAVETTQEVISGMKDAGFNTIRIPVFWGNMMENDGNYTINSDYIKRVKEIVDYCREAEVYTVINIHHFDEFIIRRHTLEESKEIFTKIWKQIAEYFKDYSDYLVFEGYNEYLGGGQINENGKIPDLKPDVAYEWTNTLNQAFVDAVRSTGGNNKNRILIVSGYWTNIDNTTDSRFKMPKDKAENKLMVSVHYIDNIMYWSNQIGNENWIEYSKSQCELLKKAFTSKGIPVFVGEFTSIYTPDHIASNAEYTDSTDCLEVMMNMSLDYGFVPVLWDVNDNFYSRTDYSIINDTDSKLIKSLAENLK